jgi:hypothetical protein
MLAKGKKSVNGKCVLLCTIDEKLWSNVAHSAIFRAIRVPISSRKLLKTIMLNKV